MPGPVFNVPKDTQERIVQFILGSPGKFPDEIAEALCLHKKMTRCVVDALCEMGVARKSMSGRIY